MWGLGGIRVYVHDMSVCTCGVVCVYKGCMRYVFLCACVVWCTCIWYVRGTCFCVYVVCVYMVVCMCGVFFSCLCDMVCVCGM